jgi:hypothetical protein
MPQPHNFDASNKQLATRECPHCGFPMLLAIIEPAEHEGHDKRIFECLICNRVETVVVNFRQT